MSPKSSKRSRSPASNSKVPEIEVTVDEGMEEILNTLLIFFYSSNVLFYSSMFSYPIINFYVHLMCQTFSFQGCRYISIWKQFYLSFLNNTGFCADDGYIKCSSLTACLGLLFQAEMWEMM